MSEEITETDLYSERAETALIGAVAFHGDAMTQVLAELAPEAFYRPARETVWTAMRKLSAEKKPLGPADVARWLTANDQYDGAVESVIKREMTNAASVEVATSYARTVAELHERRLLLREINRMRDDVALHGASASEALARVRARLDALDSGDNDPHAPMSWAQLAAEFDQAHDANAEQKPATHSPWPSLDDLTGGFVGGRVYVFGGRPGDGKSVAALNAAATAAAAGKHVLVFSQEMSTLDVTGRIYAAGAEVDLREINQRRLTDFSRKRINDYRKRVGNISLRVHAQPCTFGYIKSVARAQKHRRGLDLLVVDYLQLIRIDQPGRSREQEVAQISRELKQLSRELDAAVVVPAQLNRNSAARADGRPTKADLRDSGQIEQDADVVVLLWPRLDEQGARVGLTFIVDKNRHGPTCELDMRWSGGYGTISDPVLDSYNRWPA